MFSHWSTICVLHSGFSGVLKVFIFFSIQFWSAILFRYYEVARIVGIQITEDSIVGVYSQLISKGRLLLLVNCESILKGDNSIDIEKNS